MQINPMQIAIHPLPLVILTDDIRVGLNDFLQLIDEFHIVPYLVQNVLDLLGFIWILRSETCHQQTVLHRYNGMRCRLVFLPLDG